MNTAIDTSEEEILTWVNDNKKAFIKDFFGPFHDIFDHYLLEVVNCKKVDEYIEVEQKYISTTISKPGKIPIRLNKTEMKVPAVYYFLALFLIKWAGAHTQCMIETLLYRERTAEVKYEQIKMQNAEILKNFEDLENFTADASLTSGLMIQDLENRIRNLEADVIAKERIILEKNEANNILWEKIKALETKEEKSTGQNHKENFDASAGSKIIIFSGSMQQLLRLFSSNSSIESW
ncbi:unnamed protein product [Rhizophagus irregularis]|nr:unnamed protein product [Rhizophagus irregularis]